MDQKKMIIVGAAAAALVLIVGCVLYFYKCPKGNMEHQQINSTWFEAVNKCRTNDKRVANINSEQELNDTLKYLEKTAKLKENDIIWLSPIVIGPKPGIGGSEQMKNFVDFYTGNKTEALTRFISYDINGENGNCLATKYLPNNKNNKPLNYFSKDCFKKLSGYVLCVNY